MRRRIAVFVGFLFMLQIMLSLPVTTSADESVEWTEHVSVSGTCSTQNIRRHVQVNDTAVELFVTLTWETNGTGANLDMWIENTEGFFENASNSDNLPEIMRVFDFSNRGRWTLVIVPTSCGSGGEAHFTANVTIRNIVLPELAVSETEVDIGEGITLNISSGYHNISHYLFDFGDGTDSGWITDSWSFQEYEKSGEYIPRAKVRYSHGLESEWVEVGSLVVKEEVDEVDMFLMAQLTFIIMIIISIFIYIAIKKRKGV
jgi:hypothetical protein